MHFWGPKPLQCLPCMLGNNGSRGMWDCPKPPIECSTDGLQAFRSRIGVWWVSGSRYVTECVQGACRTS